MTSMKLKNNFCEGYQYEIQKSRDGGRYNAYKIFTSQVEEGYIPNTASDVELFMNTLKMKNNFCNGHRYEMQKSQDGGWNNAYKIIMCRVEDRNIISKHKTCLELFIATTKRKAKSQDRRGDSVKRTKKCKNLNCKKLSFNNKRPSPSILYGPRKINNQKELFAGVSLKHITVVLKKFGSKYCSAGFIQ